jgi:hypothetical protein
MKVRDSDVLVWVRGQRKTSQILGTFGLLDFIMLRPVLAWRMFRNLWTVYLFNFPNFFFSGRGKPQTTETADTESANTGARLYSHNWVLNISAVASFKQYTPTHITKQPGTLELMTLTTELICTILCTAQEKYNHRNVLSLDANVTAVQVSGIADNYQKQPCCGGTTPLFLNLHYYITVHG